ncbi:MAG: SMI1/KNR4 family protein [Chryseolinea sp.]
MELKVFKDFDFTDFWDDSAYSLKAYVEEALTDELITSIEGELGYKLPVSYIELMKLHNGGILHKTCCPTDERTSWSDNHVAMTGFLGIGRNKTYSLCGSLGSQFMINEWGYPDTGVYICNTPSAGHDMIMLDYANCGKEGEPEVAHVDQEFEYRKTVLARNFETFIRALVSPDVYDTSEQDLKDTLETFKTGRFSDVLQEYFKKDTSVNFDKVLRNLFTELSSEKRYFALHADELSHLAYDIQFYLLSINKSIRSKEEFMKDYPSMVALGNNEISTRGYANFFGDWFDERVKSGQIAKGLFSGFKFTDEFKKNLFARISKYA